MHTFWQRWLKADELERLRILKELPIFRLVDDPLAQGLTPTLLNSYLLDLKTAIGNWVAKKLSEE